MNRDKFIQRWKAHVAGTIAMGSAKARSALTSPIASAAEFGAVLVGLGVTAEELIGMLFDDAAKSLTPKPEAEPTRNGQHAQQPKQPQPVRQS